MVLSKLGRLLYGGVLAYNASENLRNLEGRIEYAKAKDVPQPNVLVPLTSAMLLVAGLGIVFWRCPRLAALGMVSWFVGVTPTMHDFWNHDGEQRQSERTHFLKNATMLGTAFVFLSRARTTDDDQ